MTMQRARSAATATFPDRTIRSVEDLNRGRGVFSEVYRVEFEPSAGGGPVSIAVKLGVEGPNGDAARRSGAYDREALAYRQLLPHLDVHAPTCHAVIDDPLGPALVLEDLSAHRIVDQLDGLSPDDAVAIAAALGRLHRSSRPTVATDDKSATNDGATVSGVRSNTVAGLDPGALRLGLATLADRWSDTVSPGELAAFTRLVDAQDAVAARFADAGPSVLCHGDPRADNLVFRPDDGQPVFFDWQQIAQQPGVGDLAWMLATSLEPATRRTVEHDALATYGAAAGIEIDHDSLRAGFALPALAVLFLAQRQAVDARTTAFIATSLRRIAQAVLDLDLVGLIDC
ncbi:MAG: phosphotransferase [Acidimicrobiales bacterium]